MHICGQTVVNLIVEQVAALLTYQDELLNVAKLVNASRQEFSQACRNEMPRATSRLFVLPVGIGAGLGFRGVGVLVVGLFCVRDREVTGGRMVGLGGEFPVKPEGADVRRILI